MADKVDVSGLRDLYAKSPTASAFLDHAAGRRYNQSESKVDRVLHILGEAGHEVHRNDVVAMFRELEGLGCGQFVVGRRGWPSRFVWAGAITSVGRTATGEEAEVEAIGDDAADAEAPDEAGDTLAHSFHLRPDLTVELRLPPDLTPDEARRLAEFVRALPFGSDA
jgi:hypothetical protein